LRDLQLRLANALIRLFSLGLAAKRLLGTNKAINVAPGLKLGR
jgi:hypothetical protein